MKTLDLDKYYGFDGHTMRDLQQVAHRLYSEGVTLRLNERRDLAQRLDALLDKAEEIDDASKAAWLLDI